MFDSRREELTEMIELYSYRLEHEPVPAWWDWIKIDAPEGYKPWLAAHIKEFKLELELLERRAVNV